MAELFEGTLWLVEEVENYWIPDIYTKSIRKLPKCPYCGTVFGRIALEYKYCPECGNKMVGRRFMMEYKIFKVTYNDGNWHSGDLPHFYYIAHDEKEIESNSTCYADFKERQQALGGDIWIHEFSGVDFPSEWENLKDFIVKTTVVPKEIN